MSSLAVLPPVGRDKSNSAVTKKSHVFQISNRGRISGWHGGQIRSPYSRLIMGVSSFTKPRLPGLFSWPANARHACPPRADGADITTAPPERLRLRLRPPRQCGRPFLRKGILAALDAKKPAVDVAQQNFRRIRYGGFDLACASRTARQGCCARERLLAVCGHDRRLAASAEDRIAETPPMFIDKARTAPCVAARPPRPGLDQHLDAAARRDAEQAKTEQAAKFAHARVALAAAASGETHGEPDLIARPHPVDALQHQLEIEAELQFTDDDERPFICADRDEIAAADFALHLEAKTLEKALDREVERGLPRRELRPLRSLTWHGYPARTTGFARVRQSRCDRNHVADAVSASFTRSARARANHAPHSPSRSRPRCGPPKAERR